MTYSDEYKVCWYTPQRTATRTTHTLLKVLGFQSLGAHSFSFPLERNDYMLISNIRNPYPRIVSIFYLYSLHNKNFNIDFEKWCEYVLTNQKFDDDYQLYYEKKIKSIGRPFDKFIRVENFSEDLKSLNFIDFTNEEIKEVWDNNILKNGYSHEFKFIQKDNRKTWLDFYNQKTADLVFINLEEQFNMFGYDRNSWKNGTP